MQCSAAAAGLMRAQSGGGGEGLRLTGRSEPLDVKGWGGLGCTGCEKDPPLPQVTHTIRSVAGGFSNDSSLLRSCSDTLRPQETPRGSEEVGGPARACDE